MPWVLALWVLVLGSRREETAKKKSVFIRGRETPALATGSSAWWPRGGPVLAPWWPMAVM